MQLGCSALLDDPNIGSLLISIPLGTPSAAVTYLKFVLAAAKGSTKPLIFSVLGDRNPLPQDFVDMAREHRVIISRSADRSMRALLQLYKHGVALDRARKTVAARPIAHLPALGKGAQPEWLGKKVLAAAGLAIPAGDLARSADEAVAIAERIGFPVAMKAQAAKLAHKTEAGGVLLNIGDATGVRAAWAKLHDNVRAYDASLTLDGVLVEVMSKRGLEMVVGAKRDAHWGPVIVAGIGGILIEAIGDVRLMPADLSEEAIVTELLKLKTSKLLKGFRGAPASDVKAIAKVAVAVGHLMRTNPDIMEIDVNPLMVYAEGEGASALDALIVMKE
jgi:hypothetical protein